MMFGYVKKKSGYEKKKLEKRKNIFVLAFGARRRIERTDRILQTFFKVL